MTSYNKLNQPTQAPIKTNIPIAPGTKKVNIPLLSYSIANATPTAPAGPPPPSVLVRIEAANAHRRDLPAPAGATLAAFGSSLLS